MTKIESYRRVEDGLNPYFFGKCSTARIYRPTNGRMRVLILIFLENALRHYLKTYLILLNMVLILIFLENALRPLFIPEENIEQWES